MRSKNTLQKAVLIQYSAKNALETMRQLWKLTNADIELYVVGDSDVLKPRQKDRVDGFLRDIDHELRAFKCSTTQGSLKVFRYATPGSLRCILLQDEILSIGTYLYEWKQTEEDYAPGLDIRGGEKPTFLLHRDDPEFEPAQAMVLDLLKNWHEEHIVECVAEFSRDKSVWKPPQQPKDPRKQARAATT
jgi:hypothetical protein